MMKIKKTEVITTIGDEIKKSETEYAVVRVWDVENMLKQVAQGEDETKLREQLLKKSGYGDE